MDTTTRFTSTIMLVEDNPEDLFRGLDLLISNFGSATIVTFSNADVAVDYLSDPGKNGASRGDAGAALVVLMGLDLQSSTGIKLMKALRETDGPSSVVILLTNSPVPEPCRVVGVDAYLTKPLEAGSLRLLLERLTVSSA